MAYHPSLADLPEDEKYQPSIADLDEHDAKSGFDLSSLQPENATSMASRIAPDLLAGLGEGIQNIINVPRRTAEMAERYGSKNSLATQAGIKSGDIPQLNIDFAKLLKLPSTSMDEFVRGLGKFIPALAIPESGAASLGGRIATNAATQGAYGASQEGPVGAVLGGIGGATVPSVEGVINKLRPSQLFKSGLSPAELMKNLEITKGTKTGLGDVIQSPSLKFALENLLRYVPGSGVDKALESTGKEIGGRAQNLVDKQISTSPYNISERIVEGLKGAAEKQRLQKEALYNESNDIADKVGLKLDLPKFSSLAKQHIDSINESTFLQHEPEAKSLLSRLVNYTNPIKEVKKTGMLVDKEGKPLLEETETSYPSLKEANILAGKLNALGKKHLASPSIADRSKGAVLSNLGKSLKSDIKGTIEKSGSDELKASFNNAEENYKNNFSGFLDKDIYKFTHGTKDPQDVLNEFIRTGSTNDKSLKLSKLMNKLPKETQDLVRYGYLSRAMKGSEDNRYIDPNALTNLWSDNKLGMEQKKALFPDKSQREALDNFVDLVKKNPKATKLMFNPETGHASLLGNSLELLSSSPMGIIGKLLGARAASNKLTDETFRTNIVKKMIENKPIHPLKGGSTLLNALLNQASE